MTNEGSEEEVERTRTTLSNLIELSGLSRREVERRMSELGSGTDLSRLLSGKLDLKLRQVIDICRIIDIYPEELFRIVFNDGGKRSPLLQRLDALTTPNRARAKRSPDEGGLGTELDDVNRLLAEVLRRLDALASTRGPGGPECGQQVVATVVRPTDREPAQRGVMLGARE